MRFVRPRTGCYLSPADDAARTFILNTLKPGEVVELEHLFERDMIYHRKIFAQINELAKALHRDPEKVRAELLYKTGNFHVIGELFGKTLISINSMSRHHMKDHELHEFWDDALQIIAADLLPQVTDPALRDALAGSLLPGRDIAAAG